MKCKKIFSIILLAMFIFVIAGCGENNIPDGISEQAYTAGTKALEITDSYLNYEIAKDDAQKQLEEISDRLIEEVKTSSFEKDSNVETCVTTISLKMFNDKSDSDIRESRDALADRLGKTEN